MIQGGESNGKVSSCKLRYEIMQDILSSGLISVFVWDFSVYLDSAGPKRLLWSSFALVLI